VNIRPFDLVSGALLLVGGVVLGVHAHDIRGVAQQVEDHIARTEVIPPGDPLPAMPPGFGWERSGERWGVVANVGEVTEGLVMRSLDWPRQTGAGWAWCMWSQRRLYDDIQARKDAGNPPLAAAARDWRLSELYHVMFESCWALEVTRGE